MEIVFALVIAGPFAAEWIHQGTISIPVSYSHANGRDAYYGVWKTVGGDFCTQILIKVNVKASL